ncbi:hypothetical protein M0802_012667 [Mischocyttarus mexicanus]|nr:hypothetical protein M0802_012667 [Mischocyttarus mexicanus]
MFLKTFYIFLLFNRLIGNFINCQNSPRIVIVGAGASGIAAASKLYENGLENILILEAQDRIGGRVYTTQFGEYVIDLGGQWVHGQKNNYAYELAAPLGLLENSTWKFATFDSTGAKIDDNIFMDTINIYEHAFDNKKYPDPSKELPIMNKTLLNSEVINIDYTGNDSIKIRTNTNEYLADHVIMTPSLGVLKADYQTLFTPPLPESKITNINGLAFGTACKIFLHFDEPWWESNLNWRFSFLFNETYRNELENNPDKKWITSTTMFSSVENKPHLLFGWVTPKGCRYLETLPDDKVLQTSMELLHNYMGKHYNITEPNAIIRSNWTHNKHFRGTYSFRSLESEKIILFAGEATSKRFYSTVHGAIDSGWREADRLIQLYAKNS